MHKNVNTRLLRDHNQIDISSHSKLPPNLPHFDLENSARGVLVIGNRYFKMMQYLSL